MQLDQVLGGALTNALQSRNPFGAGAGGGNPGDMVSGIGREARTAQGTATDARTSGSGKTTPGAERTSAGPTGSGGSGSSGNPNGGLPNGTGGGLGHIPI